MNDLQRTAEWFKARQGKVTASMIYLLLQNRKEPMTEDELAEWKKNNPKSRATTKEVPFSQTTLTYLNGKVMEWAMAPGDFAEFCLENEGGSKATRWGTDCEPLARTAYEKALRVRVEDAPFMPYSGAKKYAGGSPDGVIAGKDAIVEFKCPYALANHCVHLKYNTQQDLLTDNEQYFAQCQMNMMVFERWFGKPCEYCDFVSYDPRVKPSLQIKVLRVFPDTDYQARLAERVLLAAKFIENGYGELLQQQTIIKKQL